MKGTEKRWKRTTERGGKAGKGLEGGREGRHGRLAARLVPFPYKLFKSASRPDSNYPDRTLLALTRLHFNLPQLTRANRLGDGRNCARV